MLSHLRKAYQNPERARRRIKASIVRPFIDPPNKTISVTEQDWDTLIILDACRYDVLNDCSIFDAQVNRVHSNASHTTEFLEKNFSGKHLDTVYVSGSPQIVGYENKFAHIEHVWEDQWDDDLRTVCPEDITENAIEIHDKYPNKKLVIHYMQPHYPFIGETGQKLDPHATYTGGIREREHASIWEMLSAGDVSVKTVKKAYKENLEIVLPEVERLISDIDGKTVLTSDHANLFGKRVSRLPITIYGHPPNLPDPELVSVPRVEFMSGERRTISDTTEILTEADSKDPKERLKDLGYV